MTIEELIQQVYVATRNYSAASPTFDTPTRCVLHAARRPDVFFFRASRSPFRYNDHEASILGIPIAFREDVGHWGFKLEP